VGRFVLTRLLLAIPSLFGIALLTFVLIRLIPGDAIDFRIGTAIGLSAEQVATLERYYGLDQPTQVQFIKWIGSLAQGNLGISLRTGEPVIQMILRAAPVTLELAILSLVLAVGVGIPLGTLSALRANSKTDTTVRVVSFFGLAMPEFLSATLLVLFFSSVVRWFPNAVPYTLLTDDPLQNLAQNVLPTLVLGFAVAASMLRVTRSEVLQVLSEDHVQVAMAKGLTSRRVIARHILRNALVPIITIVGIMTGYLLTGAVIVEQIFNMPGVGRLLLVSILQRDYPVVQGTVVFISLTFILANLAADVLYGIADPRIRTA
jgi:peptide/nickel transport system permease protein